MTTLIQYRGQCEKQAFSVQAEMLTHLSAVTEIAVSGQIIAITKSIDPTRMHCCYAR